MRKFSQVLQAGRQLLLTLLSMVTRWLRSTSNLYALIGHNLEQANVDHVEYQLLRSRRSLMIDLLWCVCVVTQGLFEALPGDTKKGSVRNHSQLIYCQRH